MNVETRARRILSRLSRYRPLDEIPDSNNLGTLQLGAPIGCYENPGSTNQCIYVFAEGMAWLDEAQLLEVRFSEIAEVRLADDKESEQLMLRLASGSTIYLPIRGKHGRFRDSLEFLRFLDRVLGDQQRT